MFTLNIITYDSVQKLDLGQKIHEALRGSTAYKNNDIILNVDGENVVSLSLGDSNDKDYSFDVVAKDPSEYNRIAHTFIDSIVKGE